MKEIVDNAEEPSVLERTECVDLPGFALA